MSLKKVLRKDRRQIGSVKFPNRVNRLKKTDKAKDISQTATKDERSWGWWESKKNRTTEVRRGEREDEKRWRRARMGREKGMKGKSKWRKDGRRMDWANDGWIWSDQDTLGKLGGVREGGAGRVAHSHAATAGRAEAEGECE
jgi:hypothetical protein